MLPTRDHDPIRTWGKRNLATPAEVLPFVSDGEPAQLHFLFGKNVVSTPRLRRITWEEFFVRFDLLGLSLVMEMNGSDFEIVRVEPIKQHLHHH